MLKAPKIILFSSFLLASCVPMTNSEKSKLEFTDRVGSGGKARGSSETQFLNARSIQNRHGDYIFMTNFLNAKFGSRCSSIINSNIKSKPTLFGAVCERYSDTDCRDNTIVNPVTKTSTLRSGRIMKACQEITQNTNCMNDFLSGSSLTRNSPLSLENILKAHKAFYPLTEEFHPNLAQSYRVLVNQPVLTSTEQKWQTIALTLCISPGWQIL